MTDKVEKLKRGIGGGREAYSFIEFLIIIAIFSAIVGSLYLMYEASQTTFTRGESKAEVQQIARVAMEMMVTEVRMAGYDPSNAIPSQATVALDCTTTPPQGSGPAAIQVACPSYLTFIADVTGDGITDKVTYRLSGSQLVRDVSSWASSTWTTPSTSELADVVTSFSFTYYDGSGAVTTTLANIRRIVVTITASETAGRREQAFSLTQDVRLRNLAL